MDNNVVENDLMKAAHQRVAVIKKLLLIECGFIAQSKFLIL